MKILRVFLPNHVSEQIIAQLKYKNIVRQLTTGINEMNALNLHQNAISYSKKY